MFPTRREGRGWGKKNTKYIRKIVDNCTKKEYNSYIPFL
jgi:hypothetical protein